MNYLERWNCPNCLSNNPFYQPMIRHDGTLGECTGCGTKAVRHSCCQVNPFTPNVRWLLMTGIGIACPTCKTVYQLSEQMQQSLDAPKWLKTGAAIAGSLAIVFGLIKLGEKIEESLS